MEIPPRNLELLGFLKPKILPWRKLTIGIDGVDGIGKSTLARFLAWQLEMPVLETDMFLEKEGYPNLRYDELRSLIQSRHSHNRPVIVEGVRLLETLDKLEVLPDILIYVIRPGCEGSLTLCQEYEKYQGKYKPQEKADYTFEILD